MYQSGNRRHQPHSASTVFTLIYKRDMRSRIAGILHSVRYPRANNATKIVDFIMSTPETSYYIIYVFLKK